MALAEVNGNTYHVDNKLDRFWDRTNLETMNKKNTDRVYIVDGRERSGKSTWAIQQMGRISPEIFDTPENFVKHICFTAEQFNDACRNMKNTVIIFDEAFRGLSSRSALSKVNKLIIQTLMEMGQHNNIVFIVLPSIFMLDTYPAMLRSDGLFHISEDTRTGMRKFEGYRREDKNKIYKEGAKKGWSYPARTKFNGRFSSKFPGGDEFDKAYLKKKSATFRNQDVDKYAEENDTRTARMKAMACLVVDSCPKKIRGKFKWAAKTLFNEYKVEIPPNTLETWYYDHKRILKTPLQALRP